MLPSAMSTGMSSVAPVAPFFQRLAYPYRSIDDFRNLHGYPKQHDLVLQCSTVEFRCAALVVLLWLDIPSSSILWLDIPSSSILWLDIPSQLEFPSPAHPAKAVSAHASSAGKKRSASAAGVEERPQQKDKSAKPAKTFTATTNAARRI